MKSLGKKLGGGGGWVGGGVGEKQYFCLKSIEIVIYVAHINLFVQFMLILFNMKFIYHFYHFLCINYAFKLSVDN